MTDPEAIDLEAVKTRYEDAQKIVKNDPWNFSADEDLRVIVIEDHPALIAAVEVLRKSVIAAKASEITLAEHLDKTIEVAADAVNRADVAKVEITHLQEEVVVIGNDFDNAMKSRDFWQNRCTSIRGVLEEVKQACLFTDDDAGEIGVTTDPHIPSELFDEICAVLQPPGKACR